MTTYTEWATRRAMTRRRLLATATGMAAGMAGAAGTAGAARTAPGAGTRTAQAEPQTSKEDAEYSDTPCDGQRCGGCVNFHAPDECKLVRGRVSPTGWCRFWNAPPARRDT